MVDCRRIAFRREAAMLALKIAGSGLSSFHEIAEPVAGAGEVVVAVKHVGLCGSDLNTFSGLNPLVSLPRIPGHEIGAEIVCTGVDVPAEYAPGKFFTPDPGWSYNPGKAAWQPDLSKYPDELIKQYRDRPQAQ